MTTRTACWFDLQEMLLALRLVAIEENSWRRAGLINFR